jgi:hypothetical protein
MLAAVLIFMIQHSSVWIVPLVTANMINNVSERRDLSKLWPNALLGVVLIQNISLHWLSVRILSQAARNIETQPAPQSFSLRFFVWRKVTAPRLLGAACLGKIPVCFILGTQQKKILALLTNRTSSRKVYQLSETLY